VHRSPTARSVLDEYYFAARAGNAVGQRFPQLGLNATVLRVTTTRNGEVRNDRLMGAPVREELRKLVDQSPGELHERSRGIWREVDHAGKAIHSREREDESAAPGHDHPNTLEHRGTEKLGGHEWIEQRDVSGHAELGRWIKLATQMRYMRFGLRHMSNEGRLSHSSAG